MRTSESISTLSPSTGSGDSGSPADSRLRSYYAVIDMRPTVPRQHIDEPYTGNRHGQRREPCE